jgi:hypothetical protein
MRDRRLPEGHPDYALVRKVKQLLQALYKRALAALQEAWFTEPTMVVAGTVSAVIALASAFGVVLHPQTVELIVGFLLPIALGALLRTQVKPVNAQRAVALVRLGSRRHVISVHFWRRTALLGKAYAERLQAAAVAEGGGDWPPTDEPERQTLYEAFHGAVTPTSKLRIVKATHSERGRWIVLVVGD